MKETRRIIFHKAWLDHKPGDIIDVSTQEALVLCPEHADILEKKPVSEPLPEEKGFLPIRDYRYWEKYKDDNRFLVEGMLYPKTTNMLYSPPGGFKSLISMLLGTTIASKRDFLGLKTKKFPVLICDKENPRKIIKNRIMSIRKGLNLRQKRFPLYYLVGEGDLDSLMWIEKLKKTIEQYKIKLVIFDTLHRFSDYEENAADDLNRLYSTVFQPITQNLDCAILFLHHTTKQGDYRGTSDFLGQVDTAWSLKRKEKTGVFTLINEKNRSGELETIPGEVFFEENQIRFIRLTETDLKREMIGKISKLKEVTAIIQGMYPINGVALSRIEIIDHFRIKSLDYSISDIKHSLDWLVRQEWLKRELRGKYQRINGVGST